MVYQSFLFQVDHQDIELHSQFRRHQTFHTTPRSAASSAIFDAPLMEH